MKSIEYVRNVSRLDRVLRLVAGLLMVMVTAPGVSFLEETILRYPIFVFGIVNIVTAAAGWCVVYHSFGISSCALPDEGEV
jgi:hypothetical protein